MKKGMYKSNKILYTVIEDIKTFNSLSQEWENHVLFICVHTGEKASMEVKYFEKNFTEYERTKWGINA